MSEKASCPRCDAYVSEVFYDQCHRFCGWNCRVEWVVRAYGKNGRAELFTPIKPSTETRRMVMALADAEKVSVLTMVDGQEADDPLTAWLDPDKETPPLISKEGERRQRRDEKRARLMAEAARRIDEELGEE